MADEPSEKDVICGRGRGKWLSPGNQHMAELVRNHRQRYEEGTSKTEKTRVVEAVLLSLKGNGTRFMKFDEKSGKWFEIDDTDAAGIVGIVVADFRSPPDAALEQAFVLPDERRVDLRLFFIDAGNGCQIFRRVAEFDFN